MWYHFGMWLHCDALAETAIRTCGSVLLRGLSGGCSQSVSQDGVSSEGLTGERSTFQSTWLLVEFSFLWQVGQRPFSIPCRVGPSNMAACVIECTKEGGNRKSLYQDRSDTNVAPWEGTLTMGKAMSVWGQGDIWEVFVPSVQLC